MQYTPEQLAKIQQAQQSQQQGMKMTKHEGPPPTAVNMVGPNGQATPFMVQAKDCVDETHLHRNIATNLKLLPVKVDICKPNKGRVLIVSAGPSARKYPDIIKAEKAAGSVIVCVKHSLPILLEMGVIPDACVILDPRDIEGISTHNIKRTELFKEIPKETVFLVASMTNPSVTRYLKKAGANVIRWDAEVGGIKDWFKHEVPWSIVGGSCSAVRAMTLFKALGYSDFALLGFDCCFDTPPKDLGAKLDDGVRPKYMTIKVYDKQYLTTGELVALVQDMERLMGFHMLDFSIEVLGDGIIAEMYKKVYKQKPIYKDMVKSKLEEYKKPLEDLF